MQTASIVPHYFLNRPRGRFFFRGRAPLVFIFFGVFNQRAFRLMLFALFTRCETLFKVFSIMPAVFLQETATAFFSCIYAGLPLQTVPYTIIVYCNSLIKHIVIYCSDATTIDAIGVVAAYVETFNTKVE